MTVDEPTRHELFTWFAEQMPERLAEAMMKSIPPTGWGDIATRNDLTANAILLRGEMAEVRGEMAEVRGEMGALRGEMAEIRAEVRGDIAQLRGDMAELQGEMQLAVSQVNRTIVLAGAATAMSTWGVALAAVGLA